LLAVVPAILGLFTVAGLAYWGEFHRSAPEWLVVAAAIAAVLSLAVAWQNTRYVAKRIERLAGPVTPDGGRRSALAAVKEAARPGAAASTDEIDSIEAVVDRLSGAVSVAEAGSREREAAAAKRIQEYAALLSEAAAAVTRLLDEVRLPIHILLESPFGPLNENQEELLTTARTATEAVDVELRRLREIADLDRGALNFRRDQVRVAVLLEALKPQLVADAERTGVTLEFDVSPGLPRVAGDRVRLQEALELLLRHLVRHATPGNSLGVRARSDEGRIVISVDQGPAPTLDADVALARRIIGAHGGTLEHQGRETVITLPGLSRILPSKT
jgi:signal transduction histidine kinase